MRKMLLSSILATVLLFSNSEVVGSVEETNYTKPSDIELKSQKPKPIKVKKVNVITESEEEEAKEENKYEIFEVTAYSNHEESTGKNPSDKGYGITASGRKTKEGVTIAADWRVLPEGTRVLIEGVGVREVHDKGGAIKGKKIDLYFESEEEAINFGRKKMKIRVLERTD